MKSDLFSTSVWAVAACAVTLSLSWVVEGGGTVGREKPSATTATATSSYRNSTFDYRHNKIRGVNLGGWLVLEPWITPSLFEQFLPLPEHDQAVDEWSFCEKLKPVEAAAQLEAHWKTWVTEEDFRKLADAGINHVRIPVGYWALDVRPGEPWVQGHVRYLLKGVDWARRYNMRVLIDLHGAPGSQNGFDNSGRKGAINWQKEPDYTNRTLDVLGQFAKMFAGEEYTHVTSIQMVNEPANWALNLDTLRQFYRDAIVRIHEHRPGSIVTGHDAFMDLKEWEPFVRTLNTSQFILDTHIYHVFNDQLIAQNEQQHLEHTCSLKQKIKRSQELVPTITGEWSLATTDCAQWLNGFNIGARWDGTIPTQRGRPVHPGNSCVRDHDIRYFSDDYRRWLRRFAEVQMDAYEAGSGWYFWNFKTEREPQWSYLKGVEQGWIPRNPADRRYSCSKRV